MSAMLEHATAATRLPAQDIDRARAFYAEKLGLEPVDEQPGALLYRCGGSEFAVFKSGGAAAGTHTQMVWHVDDLDAVVKELRARGVVFEEYDLPGLTTVNGIAEGVGGWPSKGDKGLRGAWFRDSEGNLLSLGQHLR
jgi:catechol 2,3-dioxygenase-like lactoylglutathione lyase family enzyme